MSKYTTELRFICETQAGLKDSAGYDRVGEIISLAIPKIFDFDFPIFDESYRNVLCTKILKHYYNREICCETYGRWKLFLDSRLNEIMPYYNSMYESTRMKFDPLVNMDITTTHRGSGSENSLENTTRNTTDKQSTNENNESTITDTNTGKVVDKFSDTPQGGLIDVEEGNYLTNANVNDSTHNNNRLILENNSGYKDSEGTDTYKGTKNVANTDEYVKTISGLTGSSSYSSLIRDYRDALINVDMMIIRELSDLFFNLW